MKTKYTYWIYNLEDDKFLAVIYVYQKGTQALVNKIVQRGFNPLTCYWKLH